MIPAHARIVREDADMTSLIAPSQKPAATTKKPAPLLPKKDATPIKATTEKKEARSRNKSKPQKEVPSAEPSVATEEGETPTPESPLDAVESKIKDVQAAAKKEIEALYAKAEKQVAIITHEEALKKLAEQQQAIANELAKLKPAVSDQPAETARDHASDPDSVSTQWKIAETAKFNRLSTELADTVSAGESDDGELGEFAELFEDQRAWFDTTMTNTKRVGDDNYRAIVERNKRLSTLVAAQKRALPLLMKEMNVKKVAKSDYDRAATILLYDINALLIDPSEWNGKLPEDDQEILQAVKAAIKESRDPSFAKPSPSQKALRELQKKLHDTQKLIEDRNKKVLELELTVATNQDKLDRLKTNIHDVTSAKKASEDQLRQLQDKSAQDIAAMKNEKATIETQLTQAKADAKDIKTKLDGMTADATKTTQEKTDLQNQAKDLAKKIDDLQDKKQNVEKNLDEEQHKRRELEIKIEQTKFKQEQAEKDSHKLEGENTRLDRIRKELAEQVDSKNKHALELNLELERLRRELNTQNQMGSKQAAEIIAEMKKDFEQQIHELKMVVLKKDNPNSPEIVKAEAEFKARMEKEEAETRKAIEKIGTPIPLIDDAKSLTDGPSISKIIDNPLQETASDSPSAKELAEENTQAIADLERKILAERNKKGLEEIEAQANAYLQKRGLTPASQDKPADFTAPVALTPPAQLAI